MGFTRCYEVLTSVTGFLLDFTVFSRFYWVLLGFTGLYWVLLGFTGFYWVSLGFTGFYWVKLGSAWFHRILLGFFFKRVLRMGPIACSGDTNETTVHLEVSPPYLIDGHSFS